MNRRQLVTAVAAQTGKTTREIDEALQGVTDVITAVVAKGDPVMISGWAKFSKRETKARMGRNPATGEPVMIKASKKVRITALKGLKEAAITPSLAPKLDKGVWPPAPKKAAPVRKAAPAKKAAAKRTAAKR